MKNPVKILVLGLSILGAGALAQGHMQTAAQTNSQGFQVQVFRSGAPPATHHLASGRQTVFEGGGWECMVRSSSASRGSIGCKRGDSVVRSDVRCTQPERNEASLAIYEGETLLASFVLNCPE